MASMLIAQKGEVYPADLPEEVVAILKEPFLVQMLIMEPTALAFMAHTSEQKENGYSYNDLIRFADENFRDEGFIISLPFPVGRIQFTPKKKYDPALDVERSLDILLDLGIFTEKYIPMKEGLEKRYFLMPKIAEYMKVKDLRADLFKLGTFEDLFYDFPKDCDRILKKLRIGCPSSDANNT